jgi:hypothetical protein
MEGPMQQLSGEAWKFVILTKFLNYSDDQVEFINAPLEYYYRRQI